MKKITLLLFFILIINSCGVNEDISSETKNKSATYTEKVNVDELLSKLRTKQPELATFIEENPFSNFKTDTGKTDYFLDLEHIVAIKNDKNEAAYSIPLYIKSDTNSPFLYTLSIEITPENIDTKLVTKEPMDDGTFNYYGSSFDAYKKVSQTSKIKQIDCYCTKIVSDCACHSSHAAGGCDHPSVTVTCSCSGSSVPSSVPSDASKTSWSAGSGSPTAYTPTGDGIYIATRKKFRSDYEFTPLQKFTIINEPAFSMNLLDFLNTEGASPENKAFYLVMINSVEAGLFPTTKQLTNSTKSFIYSQKSPLNVDLNSILENPTLAENKKFIEVYDVLTSSPEFKNLFLAMFENNTKYNVQFEIGNIAGGGSGDTKTNLLNPTNNIITIDANFIKNNSKLVVAKTILHECIHAFLNVKLCDAGQGMSIPNINDSDLYNIINQQYNGFSPGQNQHNFIYNYMLPTMAKVLADVKDKLVSPAETVTMNALTMHIPLNESPGTNFIWAEFYHNLSLSGLQNCSFFQNEIGTFNSDGTPLITINQALMQSYNQYNNYGRNNLHP